MHLQLQLLMGFLIINKPFKIIYVIALTIVSFFLNVILTHLLGILNIGYFNRRYSDKRTFTRKVFLGLVCEKSCMKKFLSIIKQPLNPYSVYLI